MNEQSTIHALYRTPAIWNVPTTFTPLVGREKEIASLITLLRCPDIRLLTLLGTGGTGKTRLSIQLAREIQPFFLDGVCFVSLSSLNLAERVVPAIAEALHIQRISAMSAFEQVTNSLCDRHMLLILDNFE